MSKKIGYSNLNFFIYEIQKLCFFIYKKKNFGYRNSFIYKYKTILQNLLFTDTNFFFYKFSFMDIELFTKSLLFIDTKLFYKISYLRIQNSLLQTKNSIIYGCGNSFIYGYKTLIYGQTQK